MQILTRYALLHKEAEKMGRLTFEGLFCNITTCTTTPGGKYCEDGYCDLRKLWERLKAYEDTDLTPEEIVAMRHTLAEYHKEADPLLKAKTEGRLVVLPCNIDTPVFLIHQEERKKRHAPRYRVDEYHIDHFTIGGAMIPMITACSNDNEWEELIDGTQVGREFFLTREAAEKELEGEPV